MTRGGLTAESIQTKLIIMTPAINLKNDTLILSGEINFDNAMSIYKASLPVLEKNAPCRFDFSAVTHCNSACVALMVEWVKYAKRHQKPFYFDHVPATIQALLDVSGVKLESN